MAIYKRNEDGSLELVEPDFKEEPKEATASEKTESPKPQKGAAKKVEK